MIEALREFADQEYLRFNSRLVHSAYPMMGVRIPDIRKLAVKMTKAEQEDFLSNPPVWYEEVLLFGLVLSRSEQVLDSFGKYLPYIDNWATCDTVVLSFKKIQKHRNEFLARFASLAEGTEFERRALVVALLGFFLTEEHVDEAIDLALKADDGRYYVSMATAWLLATALIYFPSRVTAALESGRVREETFKRTVRKAIESYRITPDMKIRLRQMQALSRKK